MAASRSSRVTRSSVGINGLDENFCGRTLRNRSIAQPEEGAGAGSTAAAAAGVGAGVVPRSRSPKKPGGQQGKLAESKAALPAAAAADGGEQQQQQGALPRKRGVSVSERDGAAAGGEKGGAQRDSSSSPPPPPLKRAKRCPPAPPRPPGEPPQEEHEDDGPPPPAAADSPPAPPSPQAPAALKENNNRDDSTPGHAASSSSPRLGKEEDEEEEEEPEPPPQNHAHKASNGLGENGENGEKDGQPCGDPSPPDDDNAVATGNNSPALLLNGSQEEVAASSSPEPIVPCTTNSVPEEEEEEEEELCASSGEVPASPLAPPPPPPSHAPEEIPAVREAGLGEVGLGEAGLKEAGLEEAGPEEVELDVVGDSACVAHEEEVVSTSNGPAPDSAPSSSSSCSSSSSFTAINNANDGPVVNNSNDNNNNDDNNNSNDNNNSSGEAALPAPAPPEPGHAPQASGVTPPPSFVEPHEHRYTLRTSPRRAGGGVAAGALGGGAKPGGSSSSPPPPRDNNGPLRGDEGAESLGAAAHKEEEREVKGPARLKEEEEEKEEDHAPSDPRVSVDPGARGGGGVSAAPAAASREARAGKEAAAAEEEEEEEQEEEEEEEEEEEPDVYYFESDHLALKHNKDYQRLLQTIGVLEAQRTQAVLDLEQLSRHQRAALSQPIGFVEQLQKQAALGLPRPQRVVQLPDIPWGQYTAGLGDFERELCDRKRKTRRLQLVFDKVGLPVRPKSPLEPKKEGESSTMYSALPSSDAPENSRQAQMIRGRLCHQSKPDTFNQLWTVEEQKKLEQLLLKFPPEEVESKRWQKIADELGDRTSKQVASRVQKYFIKLTKAGIPVPGRTPNMCMYSKKASSKRQHHLNKHLYRQSTFLTSYEPPVYMDEEDERSAFYGGLQDQSADDSDEEGVPLECRHLPEYKELLELKRLRRRRLQDLHDDGAAQHPGYKCDVCGVEPIQGVRWHCQDCPPDNAVDFCTNCSDCLFQTETHKPGHHLTPVYQSEESFLDRDYCLPQTPGYNYLDPNYYPANR